ncbi:MAG: DinB family protein, partial [Chloroflexota bacterium]
KIIRKGVVKAKKRAQTRSITATESDLDMINVIGDPDAFDWIRPEHMEPTGTPSLSSVRQSMTEQRDECLSLLRRMPDGEGSLYTVRMSVQELGKIDMYQWIYFLVQHAYRHHIEMLRIQQEYLEN